MRLEDFDFHLPPEQIAQRPLDRRDQSRLMRLHGGEVTHHHFTDLPSLLQPGDLLVLNDARVMPARLLGKKTGTGGKAELLLARPASGTAEHALTENAAAVEWFCLGQASKGLKPGAKLEFDAGLTAEVLESLGAGEYRVRFSAATTLEAALEASGRLPLPPYIERSPEAADKERYQTVFSKHLGSVAAPTAGLHFTPEVFEGLRKRGVTWADLTLDVGPGTFMPIREETLHGDALHPERCVLPEATANTILTAQREGRRIVAVGTTVVRTLESLAATGGIRPAETTTRLFIKPGFEFKVVQAMITNFHLPKSSLLMLVSAFAGQARMLAAYKQAVDAGYRFFSYGDAMLLEDRA
ncbi:MAG: tRNA preQ1(34) S-adenosylmethionine ribosyltransferase-isomerase QueA [Myxococcaceae bacterium]